MQKHPTHKNAAGFTLIELVIAVAIIGILTSVAVLGYNQYKVRAYDAHSKQALRDILLQCNAFWLDMDASQVCNHATVAEVYVASDEIVLKFPAEDLPDLPGGSQGNFCASAQHESSPNTYSIDSASLISSGSGCNGVGGSAQPVSTTGQTFKTYTPPENACSGDGTWAAVDHDGIVLDIFDGGTREWDRGGIISTTSSKGCTGVDCGCPIIEGTSTRKGEIHNSGKFKFVFRETGHAGLPSEATRYNFETGMWSND